MKRSSLPPRRSPMARSTALTRTAMRRRRWSPSTAEVGARQLVAARSMGLCEIDPRHPATDMHHRKNRSQGGTWAVENLLHICRAHHSRITTNPRESRLPGWSLVRNQDPALTPVALHLGVVWLSADGTYLPYLPTERTAS